MGTRIFRPPTTTGLRLETDASPEDVRRTLAPHVRPRALFTWVWSGPRLVGEVTESGFDVRRVVVGRNSFVPRVRGDFEAGDDGHTVVRISFSPIASAVLGPLIWFALLANFAVIAIHVLVEQGEAFPVLAVGGMAAFGLLLLRWGWRIVYPREVERVRRLLLEILTPLGVRETGTPAESCRLVE